MAKGKVLLGTRALHSPPLGWTRLITRQAIRFYFLLPVSLVSLYFFPLRHREFSIFYQVHLGGDAFRQQKFMSSRVRLLRAKLTAACNIVMLIKYGVVQKSVGIRRLECGQPSNDPPGHVTVVDAQA